jgi:hypothetical protein
MALRLGLALAALILTGGCVLVRNPVPWRRICADGWPIKILQDKTCPEGVCGYTCAPDRWRDDPATAALGESG